MSMRATLDVRELPTIVFGQRSILWWATAGMMVIEGAVFALTLASYVYLRQRVDSWPVNAAPPLLRWGTLNTVILLVSLAPNHWTKKAAERLDLRGVRIGMAICLLFAVAFIAVRVLEFANLRVSWDTNAYGSVTWTLLGLHTTHLVTDFLDSTVLAALMWYGPDRQERFMDVSENAVYWYFVVLAWLPVYFAIYFGPRIW